MTSMPVASMESRIGIIVATNGMLSRKLEMMAEAMSSTSMAIKVEPPVTSINACASMPMTPTSDRAPTTMKRPAKKTSVVHSTCARASSMRSPEMSMRMPAAVRATTQDSMPSEPCSMKPAVTRMIMMTLWRRSVGFLISSRSSRSMRARLCSSSTLNLRPNSR